MYCVTAARGVVRCVICDVSTNGTWVNNRRIAKNQEYDLTNGDEISFIRPSRKRSRAAMESGCLDSYIFRDLLHIRRQQLRLQQDHAPAEQVLMYQKGQVRIPFPL